MLFSLTIVGTGYVYKSDSPAPNHQPWVSFSFPTLQKLHPSHHGRHHSPQKKQVIMHTCLKRQYARVVALNR